MWGTAWGAQRDAFGKWGLPGNLGNRSPHQSPRERPPDPGHRHVAGLLSSRSVVSDSVTPGTAALPASLSFTVSWSLLKLMSIALVRPSNHLILCRPLLILPSVFPSISIFSNELTLHTGGQSIGASASASVLPKNIQG